MAFPVISFLGKRWRIFKDVGCPIPSYSRSFSSASSRIPWIEPDGYDTGITLYNTANSSKVPLKTKQHNILNWYICGPTVYDSAHLGHAICYVKLDILRRIIENFSDVIPIPIMGITDIDQKIINRAEEDNVEPQVISKYYEKEFFDELDKLNVLPPASTPRVTEYITHIEDFTQKLIDQSSAYADGQGSIYFDSQSCKYHGKLSVQSDFSFTQIFPGKKHQADWALWKGRTGNTYTFPSKFGSGIPGWHIECSVMASHYFGNQLDLHSGGRDLIFPHHENEESQCCTYHGVRQWCNYWTHIGSLMVSPDVKMSKSLQNTIPVATFLEHYGANTFRILCLLTHYRSSFVFNDSTMNDAEDCLKKINVFLRDTNLYINRQMSCGPLDDNILLQKLSITKNEVNRLVLDDFNTPDVMGLISDLIAEYSSQILASKKVPSSVNSLSTIIAGRQYVIYILGTLGLDLTKMDSNKTDDADITEIMNFAVSFRTKIRNYSLLRNSEETYSKQEKKLIIKERQPLMQYCDEFRKDLGDIGVVIQDREDTSTWFTVNKDELLGKKKT